MFWANHLKSHHQLNHVPVHETHSDKVIKIISTSKTLSLNRIRKHAAYVIQSTTVERQIIQKP